MSRNTAALNPQGLDTHSSTNLLRQITKTSALVVDVRKRGLFSTFSEHLNRIENSATEMLKSKNLMDKGDTFGYHENRYRNMELASSIVTSEVASTFAKVSEIYYKYVEDANAKTVAEVKAVWLRLRRDRFLRFLSCFVPGALFWYLMSALKHDPDMLALLPISTLICFPMMYQTYDMLGYSCSFLKSRKEMKELEARPSQDALRSLLASDSVLQTKIRNKYNKEKTK